MSNIVNILVELIPVVFGFSIGFVVARTINKFKYLERKEEREKERKNVSK